MPGYGFHKAGGKEQEKWAIMLENYLINSKNLKCVFVLVDSRLPASDNDVNMLKFLNHYQIPFVVIATKCDKLKKSEYAKSRQKVAFSLSLGESNVVLASSQSGEGLKQILQIIDSFI